MNSIEIHAGDIQTFLKFLSKDWKNQATENDISSFGVAIQPDNTGLVYPSYGEFHWTFDGEDFLIKYAQEGEPLPGPIYPAYYQRMTVFHTDLEKLKQFVVHALTYKETLGQNMISMYHNTRSYWDAFDDMVVQPLDNIYMDPKLKQDILTHVDSFLSDRERYHKFGRSFKLNLLLTGVPGSGKTSLVKALAGHYKRSIYILNLSKSITDDYLIELMSTVKDNSILLIEDIDAYFLDRKSQDINISFSCLINALDGTYVRGNGTIIVMTANNPEQLDPAMIRPGRVDRIVRFDYPSKNEIRQAFFGLTELDPAKDDVRFQEFYAKIKGVRINMSGIIDFLFRYPQTYMEHIEEILQQTRVLHEIINDKTDKMFN